MSMQLHGTEGGIRPKSNRFDSPFRHPGGKLYARRLILDEVPSHDAYCQIQTTYRTKGRQYDKCGRIGSTSSMKSEEGSTICLKCKMLYYDKLHENRPKKGVNEA